MQPAIRSSRARSIAGLVIFAGLVPFLLALIACLKVPVGNPDKSRVDPALSGVWQVDQQSGGKTDVGTLWIIEPWDGRTWIVTTFSAKEDDSEDEAVATKSIDGITQLETNGFQKIGAYKAWLATFSGVRFLVLEPKQVVRDADGMTPEMWLVFKVTQPTADRVKLFLVTGYDITDAKTTAAAEAILSRHARDPALYDNAEEPSVLLRVPDTEYGRVEEMLDTLNIGD